MTSGTNPCVVGHSDLGTALDAVFSYRPTEAETLLMDPGEFSHPSGAAIAWLLDQGVPPSAIGTPLAVRAARVVFQPNGRYVPNILGSFAYVFGVIGDCALIDAAAWSPASGEIATRLGIGVALGEGQLGVNGIGTTGRPLPVWRDPVEWLRVGRCGIVIADPTVAAHVFAGANLIAEDHAHADEVSAALRLPSPKVIYQTRRIAA
jgi:hypothetical protein